MSHVQSSRSFVRTAFLSAGLLTLPLAASSATPIGFEQGEGFAEGSDVSISWKDCTPGAGMISTESANGGIQSLKILSSSEDRAVAYNFQSIKNRVVFVDFAIRPAADASATSVYTVNANGAILAFLRTGDQGTVVAVQGAGNSITTGYDFSLGEEGIAERWIHVTVRENLDSRTWDLYLDGKLTLIDLPLDTTASKSPKVSFYSSPAGASWVDDVNVVEVNPLFSDADSDGIPDAVEKASGSDPFFNDRNSYIKGATAIQRFLKIGSKDTSLEHESMGSTANVIYVDNINGNDSQSGEYSYNIKGRGPKSSLANAVAVSSDQTVIALMSSNKVYRLPNLGKRRASITITPVGEVTIDSAK